MSGEMPVHRLTVYAQNEDGRQLSFSCDGAPESPCHMYPDDGTGEERPHEECWMADCFHGGIAVYEGSDAEDMAEGSIPASWAIRSGQITASFEEGYLAWKWDHSTLVRTEKLAALLTQYACSCGETMGWITDEALVVMTPIERMGALFRIRAAHLRHQAQEEGK